MRFVTPFEPSDNLTLNRSWPLIDGLVFAVTNNDGASGLVTPVGSSRELTTGKPASAGLIHTSATPWGRGRNRTDTTSNLKWTAEQKHLFQTGDFTLAFYGWLRSQGMVLNILTNEAGSNQWRLLQDCNDSISYSSTNLTFWTYDGSTTVVSGGVGSIINAPAWYIARRRGTSLDIFRNGTLLNSATGTARDVTGSTVNSSKPISMGWGSANSSGLHGPALVWRRALTNTEIVQLTSGDVFSFVERKRDLRSVFSSVAAGASFSTSATTAAPTFAGSAQVSPVTSFAVTTGYPVFSGSASSGNASFAFTSATALPAFSGSATGDTSSGTITITDLRDLTTGNLRVNETGITAIINNISTGALVVKLTGQTSTAGGDMTLSSASLVAGTQYRVTIILGDGSEGTWKYTAA